MQENRTYVGPRGWAMLTLVGGAALAAPFLRPPHVGGVDPISQSSLAWSGNSPSSARGLGATADVSRAAAAVQDQSPFESPRRAVPPQQFSLRSIANSRASDHALNQAAGPLPTTRGLPEPKLPAWAKPRSRLDEIIAQGAAPPWPEESSLQTNLTPPNPWMNQPQSESGVARPDRRAGSSGSPSVDTPAVDETTSPKSTLSSWPDRSSPWQAHPAGFAPAVATAVDEQQLAWSEPSFATQDLPDMQASAEAKSGSQADSRSFGMAGSLAGAAVRRAASTSSPPVRSHKPQFVYQPGIRPATKPR